MEETTLSVANSAEFIVLRRALAIIVVADAFLFWSVLLAALLQCFDGEDSLLFLVQLLQLFTLTLGYTGAVYARHASGVLRFLFVFYLVCIVGDLVVFLVRLVIAYGVGSDEPMRRRVQIIYAVLALTGVVVAAFGAVISDRLHQTMAIATPLYAPRAAVPASALLPPRPHQGGALLSSGRTPH